MQQQAFDKVRLKSETATVSATDASGYLFTIGTTADTKEVCSNRIRAFVCCFTRLAAFSIFY
jgi:hypothetical protein